MKKEDISLIWQKLLSPRRFTETADQNNQSVDPIRSQFLKDVDRIIYSSYFRTLQDKTQVHPLAKSDTVRTRLTHSLEVSGVGRSLGYAIGRHLIDNYKIPDVTEHDIGYIVQAAGLCHDIGNPPFGHVAEDAIQSFFRIKKEELREYLTDEELLNFCNFDGNTQGFRIITNLAMNHNQGGFNLTSATLGTFLKYPNSSLNTEHLSEIKANFKSDKVIGTKKLGVFKTEKVMLQEISENLGLIELIENSGIFYRHPLAFLLEAADDICYNVADIEDAYIVGLTNLKTIEELLAPIARSPNKYPLDKEKYNQDAKGRTKELRQEPFYKKLGDTQKIEWLRGKAINNLTTDITSVFITHEKEILLGTLNDNLLNLSTYKNEILECKRYARENIFVSKDKTSSEIKGITAINDTLEELYKVIFNPTHPKSIRINRLVNNVITEKNTVYQNLVAILDLISSCTDRKLIELHNTLRAFN